MKYMRSKRDVLLQHQRLAIATAWLCWSLAQALAQPTNLVLRGAWPESSGGSALGVTVAGRYAYVANGARGLAIIDVSDPAHPAWVGGYQTSGSADRICLLGRYAYLSDRAADTLQIIDVNDPANPVRVGGMERTFFFAAQKTNNYLHLAAANLKVLDVSNPASPMLAANIDIIGHAVDLQIVGNHEYFAGEMWLSIYEFSNPINPTWVSTFELMGSMDANSLAVANGYAYLGDWMAGLHVIDVRDPAHPVRVGGQVLSDAIMDMEAVENALFVAHSVGGVSVFEISDPARPVWVAGYNTSGSAESLQVVGNYVFVADANAGLVILETQPLQRPRLALACAQTNALIRWPASALGFQLESKADLDNSNWITVPQTPRFTGDVFSISVPMRTNQFFRLRRD